MGQLERRDGPQAPPRDLVEHLEVCVRGARGVLRRLDVLAQVRDCGVDALGVQARGDPERVGIDLAVFFAR